jgi:hypothetical protein
LLVILSLFIALHLLSNKNPYNNIIVTSVSFEPSAHSLFASIPTIIPFLNFSLIRAKRCSSSTFPTSPEFVCREQRRIYICVYKVSTRNERIITSEEGMKSRNCIKNITHIKETNSNHLQRDGSISRREKMKRKKKQTLLHKILHTHISVAMFRGTFSGVYAEMQPPKSYSKPPMKWRSQRKK